MRHLDLAKAMGFTCLCDDKGYVICLEGGSSWALGNVGYIKKEPSGWGSIPPSYLVVPREFL